MTVLVTGASGFVGGAVVRRLVADGCTTWAGVRTPADLPSDVRQILVGSLGPDTDWRPAVVGADAVVHAAARVHVMRETSGDPLAEFRRANVAGTMALARQAAESGVRRFVFISSIKVNGEGTDAGHPYTSNTPPAPVDPYGISKHEAEQQLLALSTETGMAVSVIRPVLVYGPGVKGNFRSLMRAIERGLPLPLGAIDNRRSLVALDNLVDLIARCLVHPGAPGRTFLVSDDHDLSTPQLIQRMAAAMGRSARLVPVPPSLMLAAARVVGGRAALQRLCGSLQVDISDTRRRLDWTPPVSVDGALARAVRAVAPPRRS